MTTASLRKPKAMGKTLVYSCVSKTLTLPPQEWEKETCDLVLLDTPSHPSNKKRRERGGVEP